MESALVFSRGPHGTEYVGEFLVVPDHEDALFVFDPEGEMVPAYSFDLAPCGDEFAAPILDPEVVEFLATGDLPGWVDVGSNLYPEPVAQPIEIPDTPLT